MYVETVETMSSSPSVSHTQNRTAAMVQVKELTSFRLPPSACLPAAICAASQTFQLPIHNFLFLSSSRKLFYMNFFLSEMIRGVRFHDFPVLEDPAGNAASAAGRCSRAGLHEARLEQPRRRRRPAPVPGLQRRCRGTRRPHLFQGNHVVGCFVASLLQLH